MHNFVRSAQRMSGSDTEIDSCLPALDTCLARITARANKDQPITPPSSVQDDLHWGHQLSPRKYAGYPSEYARLQERGLESVHGYVGESGRPFFLASGIHGDAIGDADRFHSRPHQALIEIFYLSLRQASKGWRRSAIGKSMRHPPCRCDW